MTPNQAGIHSDERQKSQEHMLLLNWKRKILRTLLGIAVILGFFAVAPSVWLSYKEAKYVITVIDIVAYVYFFLLFIYFHRFPYKLCAISFSLNSLLVGLLLLWSLGPFGGGPVWLFAFPLLTGLLLSSRAGTIALGVNAAVLILFGIALHQEIGTWHTTINNPVEKWFVIGINFILLNGITTYAVLAIVRGIERALKREHQYRLQVEKQAQDLQQSNEALRTQIAEKKDVLEAKQSVEHEKRMVEHQLAQSQKMEAVGQLAGGVAHDFNNLLTIINGHTSFLLNDVKPEDPIRADIQAIDQAGQQAANVTKQLLAFSRKQVMEMEHINLNQLINEVDNMLRRMITENIEIHTSLSEKLAPIKADRSQLTQVILNLVVNSRDAMPQGGALHIQTKQIHIKDKHQGILQDIKPGNYVTLTVRDTGIGIPKQMHETIFEPFFTTKEKGHGTGLGLSTVYGIVKQSSGGISIRSNEEEGTSITVYFPVAEMPPVQLSTQKPNFEKLKHKQESILVVEDDESVRKLSSRILVSAGYNVISAVNGFEALELMQSSDVKIQLILTDVVMPKMNGKELIDKLKAQGLSTPVLYMSGYTDDLISHYGVLEQDIELITKPFHAETLLQKIRSILDVGSKGV